MDSTGWLAAAQKLDALEEHGATLEDLNTAIAELSAAVELGIPAPERLGAFSALSHALRRRFCRCEASADALACAQAAHRAVASQPAVPPGAVLYYAQMLSVVYEVAGDLNALATAASLFDKLVREPGTGAFEPPVAGLAESYLLHYQRAGNANDLDEAFGLTLPVRYTAMDPPPNSIYVQACALREMYRRTGSIQRLDESITWLARLNQPDSPPVLKFTAAYAEALIDRYRIFPASETLRLATDLTRAAIQRHSPAAGTADCQMALGYAYFLAASEAERPDETYEGMPILFKGLDQTAAAAVDLLRRAASSMVESAPRLPLCLARLGQALILLSRFRHEPPMRAEAVIHCERAAALLPDGSAVTAVVHRCLASALSWQAADSAGSAENYRLAAQAGSTSDLFEGLSAAAEWSRRQPLDASVYVEAILDSLFGRLKAEGRYTLDLIQESTIWTGDGGIIGGRSEIKRWHKPSWMNLVQGVSVRVAYARAQAAQAPEAILALERPRMVVLDCGRAHTAPPGWPQLLESASACPLVYLVAGESAGYALILDPQQSPAAKSILLPGLTAEAVETWLHGPATADSDLEGFAYHGGYIPSPDNPLQGGLLPAYSAWQGGFGGERNDELWFRPLEECGKWLGETLLSGLEQGVSATRLVLIPMGQLSMLPLPAAWLPDTSRPTGRRYLADSFTIRYLPSARLLTRPAASAATDSFFGVADPQSLHAPALAYATAEMAIASSTFPAKQVVAGDAATAQAVEAGAAAATVVHLCCHALCNFSYPDDSVLSLAGSDVLPLRNVARMDFSHARLVVLSACESSKISRKSYDQAVSFASALLGAGARAAIATGWNIDDPASSVLMLRFYHGWRIRNLPPAAALQEAQQWLRDTTNGEKADFCESLLPEFGGTGVLDAEAVGAIYRLVVLLPPAGRRYAHPHYWAAFMYSGTEADH